MLAVIRFSPQIKDELSLLAKYICGNGGSSALYKHTALIKVLSEGMSSLSKGVGRILFYYFLHSGCEERD